MKKNELKELKSLNPLNLPLEKQREIAKMGMGVSLALTAGTALLMKNPTANKLHILSGVALVGFSLWHYSLYPKASGQKARVSAKNTSVSEVSALKVRANKANVKNASTRKVRTNKAPSKA